MNLSEAGIAELFGMIGNIDSELGRIGKTLDKIADTLDRIANKQEHSTGTKKGGEA